MSILESHNTRRQFLRTLVGGVALAAMPALPIPAEKPVDLWRWISKAEITERGGSLGWMMNQRVYQMIKGIKVRQDSDFKRHRERLERRIAVGLPIGPTKWDGYEI